VAVYKCRPLTTPTVAQKDPIVLTYLQLGSNGRSAFDDCLFGRKVEKRMSRVFNLFATWQAATSMVQEVGSLKGWVGVGG